MPNLSFKILSSSDPLFNITASSMKEVLNPLYGEALINLLIERVKAGTDRSCEIFYEDNVPRGLLIFKNFLSNEYLEFGIVNGFELKTVLPILAHDTSERRKALRLVVMKRLLHRALDLAIAMNAETFFGTVSEEKGGTYELLKRLGCETVHTFQDKFKPNIAEHLLVHKNLKKFYELTQVE